MAGILLAWIVVVITTAVGYQTGMPVSWWIVIDTGTIGVIIWYPAVIWNRLNGSLATNSAITVLFYIATCCLLIIAVISVILAGSGLDVYSAMNAAHSRGAVWGFAWLTILGMMITLLPTLSDTFISTQAMDHAQ